MSKRVIFTVSPGRCGTLLLSKLMSIVPNVVSFHEPVPEFHAHTREVNYNPSVAQTFWRNAKLPHISSLPDEHVYFESSHVFGQGYVEPLLEMNVVPDIVILYRDIRQVALSMWRRGDIPMRSKVSPQWLLSPDYPNIYLRLTNSKALSDYELCLWFVNEMYCRAMVYGEKIKSMGGLVAGTYLSDIHTYTGFSRLAAKLFLGRPNLMLYDGVNKPYNVNKKNLDKYPASGVGFTAHLADYDLYNRIEVYRLWLTT